MAGLPGCNGADGNRMWYEGCSEEPLCNLQRTWYNNLLMLPVRVRAEGLPKGVPTYQ